MSTYFANCPKRAYRRASSCIRAGLPMPVSDPVEARAFERAFYQLRWVRKKDELAPLTYGACGWLTPGTPVINLAQQRRREILIRLPSFLARQEKRDAEHLSSTGRRRIRITPNKAKMEAASQ